MLVTDVVAGDLLHLQLADLPLVAGDDRAVGQRDVVGRNPAEDLRLQDPLVGGGVDDDPAGAAAVVFPDDQLLGHVDEAAGQVAGVGRPQGGVGQTLPGAVRRDEVLEHGEALTEVRLDRPGDDLAPGVGHQTPHTGDLADLHDVPSGTGADHHVDGVELLGRHRPLHGLPDLVGGLRPDLDLLLAPLVVGDDALAELLLDLLRFLLEAVEDLGLVGRGADVVDGDREAGPGREVEAEVLQVVEALGHDRPSGRSGPDRRRSWSCPASSPPCPGTGSRPGTPR